MFGRSLSGRSWRKTDWTAKLLQMAQDLKLTEDPRFARVLRGVIVSGKQAVAEKLVRGLEPLYARQLVQPDYFIANTPNTPDGLLLGLRSNGQPVNVPETDLAAHCLVTGSSGSGKTTLLMNLFFQVTDR